MANELITVEVKTSAARLCELLNKLSEDGIRDVAHYIEGRVDQKEAEEAKKRERENKAEA